MNRRKSLSDFPSGSLCALKFPRRRSKGAEHIHGPDLCCFCHNTTWKRAGCHPGASPSERVKQGGWTCPLPALWKCGMSVKTGVPGPSCHPLGQSPGKCCPFKWGRLVSTHVQQSLWKSSRCSCCGGGEQIRKFSNFRGLARSCRCRARCNPWAGIKQAGDGVAGCHLTSDSSRPAAPAAVPCFWSS